MEIKRYSFAVLFVLASFSCTTSKYCNESKNYLKRVNLSKPYWIEGIYCIQKEEIKDIENCKVTLNVYDRISGNLIEEGTAFFTDSLKVKISSGKASAIVPPGNYNVGITSFNSLPFSIKELNLTKGTTVEINCFLGSSLQF